MNISNLDIVKLILSSIIPILIYKWRTRSEVVLKQKSPFIIDLFVSLNKFHIKILKFSSVFSTQSREEDEKEFFNGFNELLEEIRDHQARAKLYLHISTNIHVENFIKTCFQIIQSRRSHEYMLSNRSSFTADDLVKEYNKWSKELPKELETLFKEKITPSLKIELNGYWDDLNLKKDILV